VYEQTGNLSPNERSMSAVAGVASLIAAARMPLILKGALALAGVGLLARAAAGHCAMKAALRGHTTLRQGMEDQWSRLSPRTPRATNGLPGSPRYEHKSRAVDESVDESFPASDPPASRLPDEPPVNAEAKWQAAAAAARADG
jgi:hypothetical protein